MYKFLRNNTATPAYEIGTSDNFYTSWKHSFSYIVDMVERISYGLPNGSTAHSTTEGKIEFGSNYDRVCVNIYFFPRTCKEWLSNITERYQNFTRLRHQNLVDFVDMQAANHGFGTVLWSLSQLPARPYTLNIDMSSFTLDKLSHWKKNMETHSFKW